jgi:hypothetical protein
MPSIERWSPIRPMRWPPPGTTRTNDPWTSGHRQRNCFPSTAFPHFREEPAQTLNQSLARPSSHVNRITNLKEEPELVGLARDPGPGGARLSPLALQRSQPSPMLSRAPRDGATATAARELLGRFAAASASSLRHSVAHPRRKWMKPAPVVIVASERRRNVAQRASRPMPRSASSLMSKGIVVVTPCTPTMLAISMTSSTCPTVAPWSSALRMWSFVPGT